MIGMSFSVQRITMIDAQKTRPDRGSRSVPKVLRANVGYRPEGDIRERQL